MYCIKRGYANEKKKNNWKRKLIESKILVVDADPLSCLQTLVSNMICDPKYNSRRKVYITHLETYAVFETSSQGEIYMAKSTKTLVNGSIFSWRTNICMSGQLLTSQYLF